MADSISRKEQIRILKKSKGLKQLLNEIYKILGNPAAVFDLYYNLIEYTEDVVTDDPLWNELITSGRFSEETIELFKSEDWIDAVASSSKITFMASDKLKYERLNAKIFDKDNVRIANVIIVACERPFEGDDSELVIDICEILSAKLQESKYYKKLDRAYQENLICAMLSGKPIDKRLVVAKLSDIDGDMKSYHHLAVVEVPSALHNQLDYFKDLFKQTQRSYKYYIYSNYIIILIGTNSANWNMEKGLKKLSAIFAANNMYAGVSNHFENPFELYQHYNEALEALKSKEDSKDKRNIFLFGKKY